MVTMTRFVLQQIVVVSDWQGLEHQMLHEIKAQGELQDFINVLKVLEQYPEVKAIRAFTDVLPEGLGRGNIQN